MTGAGLRRYDVAVVGAGPVGSVCALAHARKGARVVLLEANPKASTRLAGEWLHPPAVEILRRLGIDLGKESFSSKAKKGFAVFPEDGSEPIVLPYRDGSCGFAFEHSALVGCLQETLEKEAGIDFLLHARVREVEDGRVTFTRNGVDESVEASRIVGADGRASIVRRSLGLPTSPTTCSRMVGFKLEGVELPLDRYGYVVSGGPGPMLIYRLGGNIVRLLIDIPMHCWTQRDWINLVSDSCTRLLPETLRPAFLAALRTRNFHVASNGTRLRTTYGSSRRVLIGDAAGHYHPFTAVGMTLGFGDALTLAEGGDFRRFVKKRFQAVRVPEMLALGLYDVFADHRADASAIRQAIYRRWREKSSVRSRTMLLLACQNTSRTILGYEFSATVVRGAAREIPRSGNKLAWRRVRDIVQTLTVRLWWLTHATWQLSKRRRTGTEGDQWIRNLWARAFLISIPSEIAHRQTIRRRDVASLDAGLALEKACKRLLNLQGEDGAWEGEMAWCPMLTAQYVLLHHIMERPLDPGRRRRVLRSFERTRLDGGTWGLHDHSPPHLFVTTLVYVAARLLGVEPEDPLIKPARGFLQEEGVLRIPSWGKFWLALLNLYDWHGVNALLPELWVLPRWVPLHPSNWYCHTRLIYMAMAAIYPHRFQSPVTSTISSLRQELYPEGFAKVDFATGRNSLRDGDLYARPSVGVRVGYRLARIIERLHGKGLRARCLKTITGHIKWELRTTNYNSISPVSGFLNILALWLRDQNDPDCQQALAQLEGWFWEDEEDGARITGARSASWDTGFALQALAKAREIDGVGEALRRGADYLRQQQIASSLEGFREAYRIDPKGGWCFPGAWHGWPVTDCTAEATLGIVAAKGKSTSTALLHDAVRFMLRGQNRDGGFGTYEARRSALGLEWLNPAEMFGDSMTEHSYVECTASCMAALAACKKNFPQIAKEEVRNSISRADDWLRRTQASDGSWRGAWGVQFIYGTFFGIRGLIAGGACPSDPAVRLACQWLLERQREDGGWGECPSGCMTGRYIPHEKSQVIQTAWALIALLEAKDANWATISYGVRFLIDTQDADGVWPRQDMAGVFFRTALLDYALYRQYFPLHALGLYEQRQRNRLDVTASSSRTPEVVA